jgi:cellulose synthase/poly-beta-1,6-N-acetylglucosamine synthase-like glycosyltransferase
VIAAYNEEAVIATKIEESLALDYPPEHLEIIVAAEGSNDSTPAIAESYADRGVRALWHPERRGKMAALNRATAAATGDVVVFSDANCRYRPDALRHMAGPFADASVGVVTGHKTVLADDGLGYSEGLYWRYESVIRKAETRLGCSLGVNGEIFAVRRSLFSPAPAWVVNDDAWIAMEVIRAGYRVVYNERAVSMEKVSATAAEESERRTRIIAGHLRQYSRSSSYPWRRPVVMWQLVSHKLLRPVVPFGMAGALLASTLAVVFPPAGSGIGGVLGLAPPFGAATFGLQAGFYALAAVGDHLGRAIGRIAYLPKFLVDSNLAQIRGVIRHLRGGQSPVWTMADRSAETGVPS